MKTIQNEQRTAGITSADAVAQVGNRYDLVLIASRRMRELGRGDMPRLATKHGHAVTAMLEIEQGLVGMDYLVKETEVAPRRRNKGY